MKKHKPKYKDDNMVTLYMNWSIMSLLIRIFYPNSRQTLLLLGLLKFSFIVVVTDCLFETFFFRGFASVSLEEEVDEKN